MTGALVRSRAPATSTAPTGRSLWRAARAPIGVALVLLLVAVVVGALAAPGGGGKLDPRSYDPEGSRALATLLGDRGVDVRRVGDLPELRSGLADGPAGASTVLVPLPQELTEDELRALGRLDAPVVVVGAEEAEVDALDVPVDVPRVAGVDVLQPACPLPAAERAGTARTGGAGYEPRAGVAAVGCYATGGAPSLLQLPDRDLVLLGAADPLTNDRLDEDGNAALALGLLDDAERVLWLVPRPDRDLTGDRPSLGDVLPAAVPLAALQLAVATVLLALWRARRLGRVVVEPLPVVVRAAETVEGRSRLYRAAGARDTAASALRAGARDRLVRRLGLPPDADRMAVVQTVAARTGSEAAHVDGLLYGSAPASDAALVRLADDLDRLRP